MESEETIRMFHERINILFAQVEDLDRRMNLRTNALRNDLDDLKETVNSLDELTELMIERNY